MTQPKSPKLKQIAKDSPIPVFVKRVNKLQNQRQQLIQQISEIDSEIQFYLQLVAVKPIEEILAKQERINNVDHRLCEFMTPGNQTTQFPVNLETSS